MEDIVLRRASPVLVSTASFVQVEIDDPYGIDLEAINDAAETLSQAAASSGLGAWSSFASDEHLESIVSPPSRFWPGAYVWVSARGDGTRSWYLICIGRRWLHNVEMDSEGRTLARLAREYAVEYFRQRRTQLRLKKTKVEKQLSFKGTLMEYREGQSFPRALRSKLTVLATSAIPAILAFLKFPYLWLFGVPIVVWLLAGWWEFADGEKQTHWVLPGDSE